MAMTRTPYKDIMDDNSRLKTVKHVACKVCGKMILRTSMTNHLRIHKEQKDYTCHVCHKSFVQKATLQNHILSLHYDTLQ